MVDPACDTLIMISHKREIFSEIIVIFEGLPFLESTA
jgi:hypothetical protein